MLVLSAKKRDSSLKGKQLRREGIIPAVLYGKHLDESIPVTLTQGDIELFLKSHSVGSKLHLDIDGKQYLSILKDITRTPVKGSLEHISFQAVKADEMIKTVLQIRITGKERVDGIVLQILDEIQYRALPANFVDSIELNVEGANAGDTITIADLEISKNADIELLSPLDAVVATVTARKELVIETEEAEAEAEDEEAEESAESAESSGDEH